MNKPKKPSKYAPYARHLKDYDLYSADSAVEHLKKVGAFEDIPASERDVFCSRMRRTLKNIKAQFTKDQDGFAFTVEGCRIPAHLGFRWKQALGVNTRAEMQGLQLYRMLPLSDHDIDELFGDERAEQ